MSDREFIAKGIKEISRAYDLENHHLFPMWLISSFHYNSDLSEGVLGEIYQNTYELLQEGPAGDEMLDGFFFEEETCTAFLYQAKWPENPDSRAGKSEALEVAAALSRLLSQSIGSVPKTVTLDAKSYAKSMM